MTIQEYFDERIDEIGFDEAFDEQEQLYIDYAEGEIDLEMWCECHGVDYAATMVVGGHEFVAITLWCYDMCGE